MIRNLAIALACHEIVVVSSTMGKCEWWFDATKDLCELKGLRHRNKAEVNICPTSMKGDRSKCTGNAGAVTPGQIPAEPGLQSFDLEDKLGAWTTAGGDPTQSNERDSNGELMCMEDENFNFLDFDNCSAALSSPKDRTAGACPSGVKNCPDDVAVFDICFSCQWMMWYKKKYCHCCDPNKVTDKYENGEECCDGIDMACGLNGHDRRDGTPRGVEICDDVTTPGDRSRACDLIVAHTEKKPEYIKPKYSESTPATKLKESSITAYVHTKSDYANWLNWDPSLCYMEDDAETCKALQGCAWQTISGHGSCVRKSKHAPKEVVV